jgi:DNA-binding SARP family transcriptional activator
VAHLMISLLGSFQVCLDDQPIAGFKCAKTRALLAYLSNEPGSLHWRSSLTGLFWPERMESAALSNLRHTLMDLRQAVNDMEASPPFLMIDRETITFNPRSLCQIDTRDFKLLLGSLSEGVWTGNPELESLEKAVSLYRGEFLENFSLDDCPAFEEWILAQRERYCSQVLEALYILTEAYLKLAQYRKAETFARRQLEIEPWCEEAYRRTK